MEVSYGNKRHQNKKNHARRKAPRPGPITIDNAIAVHEIKIVQGDERLFVAMPSHRESTGDYRDIIHPISTSARESLEERILQAYRDYIQ